MLSSRGYPHFTSPDTVAPILSRVCQEKSYWQDTKFSNPYFTNYLALWALNKSICFMYLRYLLITGHFTSQKISKQLPE